MELAAELLGVVAVVLGVSWACERWGWSSPLALVVVGAALAAVPGAPELALDPDLVLLGLLPPLLYAAAVQLSLVDLRRDVVGVLLLAVVAVVVTTGAVGLVAAAVLPGLGLAAALALGAVVAPPDAVAATAVARRIGMPRSLTRVLEGESLVNDATALALLAATTTAIVGSVSPGGVALDFLVAVAVGAGVGLAVGWALSQVRARLEDPVMDTVVSLAAPFAAYLPAEELHGSGVLAVVATGLLLARRSTAVQSATSRVVERTTWRTIAFLLENGVFLLIGLQLPALLRRVATDGRPLPVVVGFCLLVLVVVVAVRVLLLLASSAVSQVVAPARGREPWHARESLVLGWAGMRGVVTLAAAFALPAAAPDLPLLQLAAFTVVAGTLLVQGLTLPALVRRLGLRGPDPAEDALAEAVLLEDAARAGLVRLDELVSQGHPATRSRAGAPPLPVPAAVGAGGDGGAHGTGGGGDRGDQRSPLVAKLRARSRVRVDSAWERLGSDAHGRSTPSADYRHLRVLMLAAEREAVLGARRAGTHDDQVLRSALAELDLEESLLDGAGRPAPSRRDGEDDLVGPVGAGGGCEHLDAAPRTADFEDESACAACLREGTAWVHLRGCLTCGEVSCCDSSPPRHAEAHWRATGHPVMRSVEPGEAWRWCYEDGLLG